MLNKRSLGDKIFDTINVTFMIMVIAATLYPFLYVLFASVSNAGLLMQHRGLLLKPLGGIYLDAYREVFKNPMIVTGYKNTLFIVVVGTALNVMSTSIAGYFLTRSNVMLKKPIMIMMLITMYFGGGLVPTFLLVNNLGLYNSHWALIIPGLVSTYNIIVMRTSIMGIPKSLEESAFIDGANDFIVLFRIILPLSLPVIAVMTLWYGVGHWNSWFSASIYIRDRELYPLQLIMREILINNRFDSMSINAAAEEAAQVSETIKHALVITGTLPILCVYPFLQKYFVKGVMIGAIKG